MSYRTSATGSSSLAGNTQVVLVNGAVRAQLERYSGFSHATNAAGTFTFYRDGVAMTPTLALTLSNLDGVLLGGQVVIDVGGNTWRVGTVNGDSDEVTLSGVGKLPLTARAVAMSNIVGYTPPPIRYVTGNSYTVDPPELEAFAMLGLSEGNKPWWSTPRLGEIYASAALTTLTSITAGTQALVEIAPSSNNMGGTWRIFTV